MATVKKSFKALWNARKNKKAQKNSQKEGADATDTATPETPTAIESTEVAAVPSGIDDSQHEIIHEPGTCLLHLRYAFYTPRGFPGLLRVCCLAHGHVVGPEASGSTAYVFSKLD